MIVVKVRALRDLVIEAATAEEVVAALNSYSFSPKKTVEEYMESAADRAYAVYGTRPSTKNAALFLIGMVWLHELDTPQYLGEWVGEVS